ncbi:hypothetical protein IMG5_148050 [Ichthyophthirius multifiliis]|uniref:DNA-directed RNA polymerases I and III subunit RPAC2 n=1 Tax=Ichthyophthirius multifiliis TaxID=5932 RepID=G0QY82_ICHMU|nr:hypothetical protein IMG5_148050 [Ichthyophthirius multifiliis]EGR29821.1 hypothetical protein IMG5_148050 [Ichthyophthirius multifiliis]|eukprot:XP_004031057.1 hypothetical protein IMG5_148050 [Ichthyophthirius multifiliis]
MSDSEEFSQQQENQEEEIPNIEEEEDDDIMQEEKTQKPLQEEKLVIDQNEKDKTSATYIFYDEDHTLGNALRYVLVKRKDVEFCGYTIPHPSENRLNLRLQTSSKNSNEVLKESLDSLAGLCDVLNDKFVDALKKHKKNQRKH